MKRLGPNVRLEQGNGRPVLRYLPQPGQSDLPPLPLHPLLALVLALLDRGEGADSITAALAPRLDSPPEAIKEIADDVRLCFKAHFRNDGSESFVAVDTEALAGRLAVPGAVYRSRDLVFPGDRALFPLTLQWLVTRYCNRHCIYCFAGATPGAQAKDAAISGERMREVMREAARLGAFNLFLTGGEPLLRDDIYDLIAYGLSLGYAPEILSNQFIPDDAAAKLAEAGLPQIFLSVDSLDPATARRLTGVVHFAREIALTIERLVAHGIMVNAKSVLTSENIDGVPATVAELERLGVRWVGLETYSRNLERHSDHLSPSREQLLRLRDWTERFRAETDHGIEVSFTWEPDRKPPTDLGPDCFVCHNGSTALLVLPDGRISRCDKRLPGNEFIVGDLKTQSVHEAWRSPEMLASLKPPRDWYAGTQCHDCAEFATCHERGRCYYNAYLTSGTLFGPQSGCPYIDAPAGAVSC
ncbi:MAG TPA: radical SAM protein [Thermoanaerobaculia bacterium]|nr:radical SAM protein [Thermoanaerobaculia bacterium]